MQVIGKYYRSIAVSKSRTECFLLRNVPTHFRQHHSGNSGKLPQQRGTQMEFWLDIFNYLRQTFAISAVKEKKGLFCFSFQHIDLWSRCNYSTLLLIHLEKLSWILNNFCSQQAEPKYTKIVVLFKFCYKFSTSSGAFLDELDGNFWTE